MPVSDFQMFSPSEIASLRHGGKILRSCLHHVASMVQPGITTRALDAAAEKFIRSHEAAFPAFKGYQGFPGTLCTSTNDECVHGIPGDRVLRDGDIIALDCGVFYDGLYTDACVSVGVGTISPKAQRLLDVAVEALDTAIAIVREGTHVGDISSTIQSIIEKAGMRPVRGLTGHGLGSTLHQFPDVPNEGKKGTGPALPAFTLIAIEPIVSLGSNQISESSDGWTLSIEDGALSSHSEHTILVTPDGCEIIA